MEQQSNQEPERGRRGCGFLFFVLLLGAGAVWGAMLGGFVWVLQDAKTTIQALEEFRPKVGSKVYSADDALLGEYSTQKRQLVNLNQIPIQLQKAFIATEDKKFYQHKGVRPESIVNVLLERARTGRTRGASTITQQVVRNVEPLGVGQEHSYRRKLREAIIALQVERDFTKDEILELYLNQTFLGISAYGVQAASLQYYGEDCSELTLSQCALLAGLARAPNSQQPLDVNRREGAFKRRDIVLNQMLKNEFISQQEYEAALKEPVEESLMTPEKRRGMTDSTKAFSFNRFKAPYFVEEVGRLVNEQQNKQEIFEEGLEIHTTLDMRLQKAAEEVLGKALDAFDAKKLDEAKRQHKENEFAPVSGALVCIDNRPGYKGYVRALVGGRNFDKQKFNCATQAKRQPGSAIKPFVWTAAIDNGRTPSTIVVDEPFTIAPAWGPPWSPKNFTPEFAGSVSLRVALQKSINIVSVKLVKRLTLPVVRQYLQRAGITTPIENSVGLTIALGTPNVYVIDMCVAYSTFANGGMRYDPVMITEIKNRDGMTIYEGNSKLAPEPAMPANVACVMTHLMEGVCRFGTGAPTQGKWEKAHPGLARAGKTGTTNDSRDAWFCGFTPHYTCVVWMGYPDKERSLGHGSDYTGGHLANPIWTDFMVAAEDGLPPAKFDIPDGVVTYKIDRTTGELGGNFDEYYVKGTSPEAHSFQPEEPMTLDETTGMLENL